METYIVLNCDGIVYAAPPVLDGTRVVGVTLAPAYVPTQLPTQYRRR